MQEIVLIVGFPAAGKSTLTKELVKRTAGEKHEYIQVNRDIERGSIADLLPLTEQAIHDGKSPILDNTFLTIESREPFIELAKKLNVPIRCVWLDTSFEDAQMNACLRMLQRVGHIMSPEELKETKDPNLFPPAAIFAAKSKWEGKGTKYSGKQIPKVEHGFSPIEKIGFNRTWPEDFTNKALILDYDGTLRESNGPYDWPTKPEEVQILPGRTEVIQQYKKDGYLILGASNQSAISKGLAESDAIACFEQTNKLLGVDIQYMYCPHSVPPVKCFCRKPSVGIGATFIWKYKLCPSDCIFVGDMTTDETFAKRCGFKFEFARDFFGDEK